MATIEIDFDVYKHLTALRRSEADSFNEVLRRELKISTHRANEAAQVGAVFKGVTLPEGTELRATYKGKTYTAKIQGGLWIDSSGGKRNSPTHAAVAITGKNWNGWNFWECRFPGQAGWKVLSTLRSSAA